MKRFGALRFLLLFSLLTILCAGFIGPEQVRPADLLHPGDNPIASLIFWQIRVPRVLLAWLAGAGLALAGMVFQAMFRNALATPFTLGVSSGASLGAAIGVRFGALSLFGFSAIHVGAMLGAMLAISVVYGITRLKRDFSTGAMLLAGVAVNFFFSSLILLIQYMADFYDTFRILRWLMGGLRMVGYDATLQVLPFVAIGALLLWSLVSELNLLTTGEELAISRGVAVGKLKTLLFFTVSIIVGVIVSICGPVGFVGLMCPHICRLLVGADHRRLLPATVLFGGCFLVICDTVARTAFAPTELPVGIFTSFLGGPFFLYLLIRPPRGSHISG